MACYPADKLDAIMEEAVANGATPQQQKERFNDTIVGDPDLSPHLTLQQQKDMGDAWEAREAIEDARRGKKGGKPSTYSSNAYRISLDRSRHLIRYVEGKITFDNFMEEILESCIMEHLVDSGHTIDWYTGHLRETQKLLTERGILKGGKKLIREDGEVGVMDVVEALGQLARADVYARIDSLNIPQFIKDFLKWCRTLIGYVAHMAEMGKAVRELADTGKLDKDFVQTIYDAAGITQEWWADAAMDSTHQTLANIATAAVQGMQRQGNIADAAAAAWSAAEPSEQGPTVTTQAPAVTTQAPGETTQAAAPSGGKWPKAPKNMPERGASERGVIAKALSFIAPKKSGNPNKGILRRIEHGSEVYTATDGMAMTILRRASTEEESDKVERLDKDGNTIAAQSTPAFKWQVFDSWRKVLPWQKFDLRTLDFVKSGKKDKSEYALQRKDGTRFILGWKTGEETMLFHCGLMKNIMQQMHHLARTMGASPEVEISLGEIRRGRDGKGNAPLFIRAKVGEWKMSIALMGFHGNPSADIEVIPMNAGMAASAVPATLPENAVKFAEAQEKLLTQRRLVEMEIAKRKPDADVAAANMRVAELTAQIATWQQFWKYPELLNQATAWNGDESTLYANEPAVAVDLSGGNSGFSASFIGEHADTWASYQDRQFRWNADNRLRAELDSSIATLIHRKRRWSRGVDDVLQLADSIRKTHSDKTLGDILRQYWAIADEFTTQESVVQRGKLHSKLTAIRSECYTYLPLLMESLRVAPNETGVYDEASYDMLQAILSKKWEKANEAMRENSTFYLDGVLHFPELFAAYPQLRNVRVAFKKGLKHIGETSEDGKDIAIRAGMKNGETINTVLHEVQHVIQGIEGFAEGGNETSRGSRIKYLEWVASDLMSEMSGLNVRSKKWKKLFALHKSVREELDRISSMSDHEYYLRLGGEQEARAVEKRRTLKLSDRLSRPMEEDIDFSDEIEIYEARYAGHRVSEVLSLLREHEQLRTETLSEDDREGRIRGDSYARAATRPRNTGAKPSLDNLRSSVEWEHSRGSRSILPEGSASSVNLNDTASFSFVGENAENWEEIKHLAFIGRDDGKLRVELDASQARIKPDVAARILRRMAGDRSERKVRFTLGDILDYPELYACYPKLAKMAVVLSDLGARGTRAWYNPKNNNIRINTLNFSLENWDAEALRSTLLHEVQHAIQHIEGYASGNGGSNWDEYQRSAGEIEARAVQKRRNMTAEERAANPVNDMLEFPGRALVNIDPPPIEVPFNLVSGAFDEEWGALRRSGNKAHMAFMQNLIAALNKDAERLARYQTLAEDERGDMAVTLLRATNLAKTAAMYLPKGWRIGLKPYLDWMEVFSEVAHHGKLDWSSSAIAPFWEERMQEHLKGMMMNFGIATGDAAQAMALLKDYGETRLYMLVNKLLKRVSGQLEEYGKAKLRDKIEDILLSLEPKTRPNRRMQRGVVSKEAFDEIMKLVELMHYDEKQYQEAHEKLVGKLTEKAANGATQEEREALDNKLLELEVYGCMGMKSLDELDRLYTCLVRHIRGEKEAWKALHEARQQRRRELAEGIIAGVRESKGESAMEQKSIAAAYANLNGKGQKKSWLRVGASAAVRAMESLPQLLSVLARHKGTAALAEDIRKRLADAGKDLGIREKYHDKLFRTWFAQAFGLPTKGVKANFALDKAIVAFNATKDLDIRLKEYEKKNLRLPLELALMRISGEDTAELRAELEAKLADLQTRLMQENGGLPLSEQDKADIALAESIRQMPALAITPHEELDKGEVKEVFRGFGEVTNKNDQRMVKFPAASAGKIIKHQGFKTSSIVRAFGELYETSVHFLTEKEIRKDGHKEHNNHETYEHYVNKFSIGNEEYYIRFTVPVVKKSKEAHVHSSTISEVHVYKEGNSTLYPANDPGSSNSLPVDKKLAAFFDSVNAKIKQSQALPPTLETDAAIKETEKRLAALDMELDAQDIDALRGWFALNPAAKRAAEILAKPEAERTAEDLQVINKTFKARHANITYNRFLREQQTPLNLSKNSALYHILAYEQEDNRPRMEVQGWTADVINRLREYVGKEGLKLGELMREHLNTTQRARIAAIFERENGIPFANIPNYFPLRFMRADKELQDFDMAAMLDGMSGGMGGGLTGFLAQRTDNHDLPLAINLGATSVWRDAVATFRSAGKLWNMATDGEENEWKDWMKECSPIRTPEPGRALL